MKKFVCSVCGYVYEGEAAPEFCPQCKAPVLPHTACKSCGYYDGVKVMRTREEIKAANAE